MITCDPEGLIVGDRVSIIDVEGMIEINDDQRELNEWPTIVARSSTSITVNVDSTNFTAYSSAGSVSKIIEFSATTIPWNPYRDQGDRVYVERMEFLLDTNAGYLQVATYVDEEETPIADPVLLIPTSTTKAREWITMTVNQEANFFTWKLTQQSASNQVRLTSIRISYMRGGTDG